MNILLLIKTFILLIPLGYSILDGPAAHRVFLLGSVFPLFELVRAGQVGLLGRAWPIPALVGLYVIGGSMAPEEDLSFEGYGSRLAIATAFYGVCAGFCLALWSQKKPGAVLLGFIALASVLTIAANTLVQAVGPEDFVKITASTIDRRNPDTDTFIWGIFKSGNITIGIIPMTLLALSSLPLLLLPGWSMQKLIIIMASIVGAYTNILVATRTTLLAAALSFVCVFIVLCLTRTIKTWRMIVLLSASVVAGIFLAGGLVSSNVTAPLKERLLDVGRDDRFNIWRESARLVSENPFGGGNNNRPYTIWAHNVFLDCGLTNGWLGMAAMFALFVFVFYTLIRTIRKTRILGEPVGLVFFSVALASAFVCVTEPPIDSLLAFTYIVCCYFLAADDAAAGRLSRRKARARRKSKKQPSPPVVEGACVPQP